MEQLRAGDEFWSATVMVFTCYSIQVLLKKTQDKKHKKK